MTHSNRYLPYVFGAALVAAVLIAFGAPLASLLPFAIVLACPLMMVVMMRGMAGMHGGGTPPPPVDPPEARSDSTSPDSASHSK